ncbi:unnamed protein product, partial [Polarella glacialis]
MSAPSPPPVSGGSATLQKAGMAALTAGSRNVTFIKAKAKTAPAATTAPATELATRPTDDEDSSDEEDELPERRASLTRGSDWKPGDRRASGVDKKAAKDAKQTSSAPSSAMGMVSLPGDVSSGGMLAVRHARLIQQLILATGDEAAKCHEKWQRRHAAALAAISDNTASTGAARLKENHTDLSKVNAEARKASTRLRLKKRSSLASRLAEEVQWATFGGPPLMPKQDSPEEQLPGALPLGNPDAAISEASSEASDHKGLAGLPRGVSRSRSSSKMSAPQSLPSSTESDDDPAVDELEVPGVTARRGSNVHLIAAELRTAAEVRRRSSLQGVVSSMMGQEGRRLSHVVALLNARKSLDSRNSDSGATAAAAAKEAATKEAAAKEAEAAAPPLSPSAKSETKVFELTPAIRRRLPEVFGLRKFRDQSQILGGSDWAQPAGTMKRFHVAAAQRLGLESDQGDWDPSQLYKLSIEDLELLAVKKQEGQRHQAATVIQKIWKSYHTRRSVMVVIEKRRKCLLLMQAWWKGVFARHRLVSALMDMKTRSQAATRIQSFCRRWLVQFRLRSASELHRVLYRLAQLQESLYPAALRQPGLQLPGNMRSSCGGAFPAEGGSRKGEVLQPAFRRFLRRLRQWQRLRKKEQEAKELKEQRRRLRANGLTALLPKEKEEAAASSEAGSRVEGRDSVSSGCKAMFGVMNLLLPSTPEPPLQFSGASLGASATSMSTALVAGSPKGKRHKAPWQGRSFRSDLAGARGGPSSSKVKPALFKPLLSSRGRAGSPQ